MKKISVLLIMFFTVLSLFSASDRRYVFALGGFPKVGTVADPNWGADWVDYRTDDQNRIMYIWVNTLLQTPAVGKGSLGQTDYQAFIVQNSGWWGCGYYEGPDTGNPSATMDLTDVTSSGNFHFAIRTNCATDITITLSGSTIDPTDPFITTPTSGKIVLSTAQLPLSKRDATQWVEFNIPMSQFMTNAVVSTNNLMYKAPIGKGNYLTFTGGNDYGSFIALDNVYITNTAGRGINISSSLSGFNYNIGSGPSAEQILSISGNNLTSNILITPPANFQISTTSGSGFTNSPITLTQSSGNVNLTNIYVRLKAGLNFGNYSDSITVSSTGNITKKVSCTGSVVGPTINSSISSISNLNYNKGSGPSAEQIFSLNGTLLTSDIILTPSSNIQISKTTGSGFVNTPITLTQSSGTVSATSIYVRLKAGLNFGNYTDSISITSTNAITKKVICSGKVTGPGINSSFTSLAGFSYVNGAGPSTAKTFMISGTLLEADLIVTPSANYEISANGNTYVSTPLSFTSTGGTLNSTTVYVRLKSGLSAGTYNENITLQSTGAVPLSVACDGTVLGPKITVSTTAISGLNYGYNSGPSDQQSFTVSGKDLLSDITITPNINFQISTVSGGSFSSVSMKLAQTGGIVNEKTIFVRMAAGLKVGIFNGDITLTSTSADTKTISCNGTVANGSGLTYTVIVPVSTKACYIGGTMNGWILQSMTKIDATHYTITLPAASLTDIYKYYSGPGVSYIEKDGTGADIANRSYTSNDIVANWASVFDPTTYYNISIQVGANGVVSENNVTLLNGSSLQVNTGTSKIFTFTPDAGYRISTLTYNGIDVKSQVINNQFTTPPVISTAALNVTFEKVQYKLVLKSAESGTINLFCNYGETHSFDFTPSLGWSVNTILFNGTDVTNSLVNGIFITPAMAENSTLSVSFGASNTGVRMMTNINEKVYTNLSGIVVEGVSAGEKVDIFTIGGANIISVISKGSRMVIPAETGQVYLVKTFLQTFKVIM